jgi:MFS family permease
MLQILRHPVFQRLFAAQILALMATGLLTIALGLLAFDIAGDQAGQVLGLALTIKMLAYVGVAPVMTALVARLNRKLVLLAADMVRAAAVLTLPFMSEPWHIYCAIFFLQAASATFTPTFQALIPEILKSEDEYTRALSLTRLAYDAEALLSPIFAAVLLAVMAPSSLFLLTALGFVASAALVVTSRLPQNVETKDRPFRKRVTLGCRIYFATPRLRALLALSTTVAAIVSVVLVQSVVIAKSIYGGDESALAILLAAYGLGSALMALALPRALDRFSDRQIMLPAGAVLAATGFALAAWVVGLGWPSWGVMLAAWLVLGAANSGVLTPAGRLLRRSANIADRAAIFAAQFTLSHAAFLVCYPAAGFLGAWLGVEWALLLLSGVGIAATLIAAALWPSAQGGDLEHVHSDLPEDHPHLKDAVRRGDHWVHRHTFVIDDQHRVWPTSG